MICNNCGEEMHLDDVDLISKGNKDKYYVCDNCGVACIEEIRDNKQFDIIWDLSDLILKGEC